MSAFVLQVLSRTPAWVWMLLVALLVLALLSGRILRQPAGARYACDTERYIVPGSWAPLILILTIFCTRYLATVSLAIDPSLGKSLAFTYSASLIYGLLSGTLLARALHVLGSKKRI